MPNACASHDEAFLLVEPDELARCIDLNVFDALLLARQALVLCFSGNRCLTARY